MSARLSTVVQHTAPRLALVGAGRPSSAIRVVIAHERRLVRAGLRALLERDAGILVVGEAATPEDVAILGRRVQPDVLLAGSPALAGEPVGGLATLVLSARLEDEHPAALVLAVRSAARRRNPRRGTPQLKLIQGGSPWNSGT